MQTDQVVSALIGAGLCLREVVIVVERAQGVTLQKLGDRLGLTKERVWQIEKQALGLIGGSPRELELLGRLRKAKPPTTESKRLLRIANRKKLQEYFNLHPSPDVDYQRVYAELGIEPQVKAHLMGVAAITQIYADYRTPNHVGSYWRCTTCKAFKARSEFLPRNNDSKGRYVGRCRECNRLATRSYWRSHPKQVSEMRRAWYKANTARAKATHKRWEIRRKLGVAGTRENPLSHPMAIVPVLQSEPEPKA